MKTVVINRATWAIPRQTEQPLLLNSREGTRCCLGFYAKACGIKDETLLGDGYGDGISMPSGLNCLGKMSRRLLRYSGVSWRKWEDVLQGINDADNVTDAERESWVRAGFRYVLKRQVRFIGKYRVKEPRR